MGLIYCFTFRRYKQYTMIDNFLHMMFGGECIACYNCFQIPCVCNSHSALNKLNKFSSNSLEDVSAAITSTVTTPTIVSTMRRSASIMGNLDTGKSPSENEQFCFQGDLDIVPKTELVISTPNLIALDGHSSPEASPLNGICPHCKHSHDDCHCVTEQYGPYEITHIKSFDDVRRYKDIRDSPQHKIRTAVSRMKRSANAYVGGYSGVDEFGYM
jgi:hypothetical protein